MWDERKEISIGAAESGGVRMTSDLDYEGTKALMGELREVAGQNAEIKARLVVWAGPYEVFMAVKPILDTAGALLGGVGGVAGLLTLLVKRNPERPITVYISQDNSVTIDGQPLSEEQQQAVNEFFQEHSDDPDEEIGPSNQPI